MGKQNGEAVLIHSTSQSRRVDGGGGGGGVPVLTLFASTVYWLCFLLMHQINVHIYVLSKSKQQAVRIGLLDFKIETLVNN